MMKRLAAKRIGTGYYEVATSRGTYRVENISAPKGSGGASGWFVFPPGETLADTFKATKREAMAYIQTICVERRERPTLEDVELPSDAADREQAQRGAEVTS